MQGASCCVLGGGAGTHKKRGVHAVEPATKQPFVAGMDKGGMTVECICARLVKVHIKPTV